MAIIYAKTDAGQAEIRQRSQALARHARTLLVLADGSRSGEQLLAMVQGAGPQDLAALLEAGLIAEVSGSRSARTAAATATPTAAAAPAAAPAASAAPEPPSTQPGDVEVDVELSYAELYDSLNALSKEQLGLFKGYKFALEIEKADGIQGLREVAVRLVDEVHKAKGESAAQMVRRALGLKR